MILREGPAEPDPRRAADGPAGLHEERRARKPGRLATGSLACPRCDAPVALAPGGASPADALACPFCDHAAALRDFLSLAEPLRAPRVQILVRTR